MFASSLRGLSRSALKASARSFTSISRAGAARGPFNTLSSSGLKPSTFDASRFMPRTRIVPSNSNSSSGIVRRFYGQGPATTYGRVTELPGPRVTLSPTGKAAVALAVLGGVTGLGTIYFYGNSEAALNSASFAADRFSELTRERLSSTYSHIAAGLGLTAGAGFLALRSGIAHRLATLGPWANLGVSVVALMGTSLLAMSIPYDQTVAKHGAWALSMAAAGAVLSPIGFLGGPILMNAAIGTACMVGSLSLMAASAPSESFMWMAGPLSVGLGVVIAAGLGSMFFPQSRMLMNVVMYGGLAVFGGFMLYDTQKVIQRAKYVPANAVYDPINEGFGIYWNTIQIFVRLAYIFSMQGNNSRR